MLPIGIPKKPKGIVVERVSNGLATAGTLVWVGLLEPDQVLLKDLGRISSVDLGSVFKLAGNVELQGG
jgi:hypothetical protein